MSEIGVLNSRAGKGFNKKGNKKGNNNSPPTSLTSTAKSDIFGIVDVVVEGCDLPEVNGIFKRSVGSPVYRRSGRWGVVFEIEQDREVGSWKMWVRYGAKRETLLCNSIQSETLPENGWFTDEKVPTPHPFVSLSHHT